MDNDFRAFQAEQFPGALGSGFRHDHSHRNTKPSANIGYCQTSIPSGGGYKLCRPASVMCLAGMAYTAKLERTAWLQRIQLEPYQRKKYVITSNRPFSGKVDE